MTPPLDTNLVEALKEFNLQRGTRKEDWAAENLATAIQGNAERKGQPAPKPSEPAPSEEPAKPVKKTGPSETK